MIQVFIQAEAGSCDKHVYQEKTLTYLETRRVPQPYPYAYGFILGTNAADGGNLDCYLLAQERLQAGTIVACEPVALLVQREGDEVDDKIIAVLAGEGALAGQELPPEQMQDLLLELQAFIYAIFARFPDLELRVGPILPRQAALQTIHMARALE